MVHFFEVASSHIMDHLCRDLISLQGHSRRLLAQVKPVQNSGTLPIICESIQLVSIGCVCARSKLQKGLDRSVVQLFFSFGT